MFFKLIKVLLLVSKLYIYQNARCNDKKTSMPKYDIGTFIYLYFLLFFIFLGGGGENVKGCNEHRSTGLSHVRLLPSCGPIHNYKQLCRVKTN